MDRHSASVSSSKSVYRTSPSNPSKRSELNGGTSRDSLRNNSAAPRKSRNFRVAMATKQCGFPSLLLLALPLILLAATSSGHNFGQCQVPRLDQEFCNSFYSVCLASPDKLCLAQSLSHCLGSTGFPSGILYSISTYLVEFINRLKIIIGPLSPPSPPPPIIHKPSPPPPPHPLPPLSPPLRPINWPSPPQPPRVVTPPPPPSPPIQPIYWPLLPQAPIQPQTKPRLPVPYPNIGPIFIPGGSSIPSLPPKLGPKLITVYETGNDYLDYFISLLLSLQEKEIHHIIGVKIPDIGRGGLGHGQVRSQDINVLLLKLKYLLQRYSSPQEYDVNYLDTYLHYLVSSSASLFNWFSLVLDQIYFELEIQLPSGGSNSFPRFSLEGVFSTNVAYRQSVESCNGAPVSGAICERYCTNNYGGNWIAIQYRERDMELPGTFDRSLIEYTRGFGDYQTGYWMGLACLSDITSHYKMELLVELADASGVTALAHYGHFRVGDQSAGYPLQLGTFLGGAAGDGLRSAEGRPFTTRDSDNDQFRNNCAVKHKGGWWYANCQQTSAKNYLNGYFSIDNTQNDLAANFPNFGVRWQTFDTTYVLVSTRMFMRRASATSDVGFPVYDYELVAGPYGLETFGGALGLGEENYAFAYDEANAGNLGGYEETYDVAYIDGAGAGVATGDDTYEYDGGDHALVYDTGAGAGRGSYGLTYGSGTSGNALVYDTGAGAGRGSYGSTYGSGTSGNALVYDTGAGAGRGSYGSTYGSGTSGNALVYDTGAGAGRGSYGSTYESGTAGNALVYDTGAGAGRGSYGLTYESGTSGNALVYDTGAGAGRGSYGSTYGSGASGSTSFDRGVFDVLNG